MKRILFITHELSRTGAPMVLLLLGRWLRAHRPHLHMDLLALDGGDMREAFADVFGTVYGPKPSPGGLLARLKQRLGPVEDRERLLKEVSERGYQLIYANTVLAIPAACRLKDLGGPQVRVIAHVHELNSIIRMYLPTFRDYVARVDRFIAVSQLVKDELVQHWGVPPERITVVYEFSEVADAKGVIPVRDPARFEVGASGQVHWRKGHDLFIQVAQRLRATHPEVPARFTWVGRIDAQRRIIAEADLAKAGLSDMVRFVGEQQDPLPWFRAFDVFLLPSREDPFPLVCIEVGMMGVPIICFQGATGIAEVLHEGGGSVVPYLDVQAMADGIAALWHDPAQLALHRDRAREVFRPFTPEDRCPAIGELIADMQQ